MREWTREHVLKLSSIPNTKNAYSGDLYWLCDEDKFTQWIDKNRKLIEHNKQFALKVLSDVSHLHQNCISLLNLIQAYERNEENLTDIQKHYCFTRILRSAIQIDNGRCFSPLDPRNERVRRNEKGGLFL